MNNIELKNITSELVSEMVKSKSYNLEGAFKTYTKHKHKIISHLLEFYGGSTSHEFLVRLKGSLLSLTDSDWREILSLMNYNKALGQDSLYSFFLFFTKKGVAEISKKVKFSSDIVSYYETNFDILPSSISQKRINDRLFKRIGLTDQEISLLENYSLELVPDISLQKEEVKSKVVELLKSDGFTEAVKLVMEEYNVEILIAKNYVDKLKNENGL